MSSHAKFSPSGADRWIACPASITLSQGEPDSSSVFANEGSVAHWVAEQCLLSGKDPSFFVGEVCPEYPEIEITTAMANYVSIYIEHCRLIESIAQVSYVEEKFEIMGEDCKGTADFAAIIDEQLHIIDLKYGQGKIVSPIDNPQLKLYAYGAYKKLIVYGNDITIHCSISQPRVTEEIQTWSIHIIELKKWVKEVVEPAIANALSDNPTLKIGKHCTWCKAKLKCPAMRENANSIAKKTFEECDDQELSAIMKNAQAIRDFLDACEKYAEEKIMKGEVFPGFKLVKGRASAEKWVDDVEATELEMILGEDAFKPKELKTPTQIKTMLKQKKQDVSLVDSLTHRPEPKLKLVEDTEKGEAVTFLTTAQHFS
jgi:hypothetical protein